MIYLTVGTRVTFISGKGERRPGRVKKVFEGSEYPYLVKLDDKDVVRCGLRQLDAQPVAENLESVRMSSRERT